MVLTVFVIMSGGRKSFLGEKKKNCFGEFSLFFVHGTCCIRSDTGSNDSGRTGDGDSDLYLFGRNTGRDLTHFM